MTEVENESSAPVPRIHVVGRKNAGKTTLVCQLVSEFSDRGLRVATIKHTHHQHELDTPGKDSHRHREAGAAGVGILSPTMTAAFVPESRSPDSEQRYRTFETMFADCDLLIVEGDLGADARKIEVWRSVTGEGPYAADNTSIQAVVTDEHPDVSSPCWPRSDLPALADRILSLCGI